MKPETQKALSSLEWALAESTKHGKQPDEFTAHEYAARKGCGITSGRIELNKMAEDGLLERRAIKVGSAVKHVFKRSEK